MRCDDAAITITHVAGRVHIAIARPPPLAAVTTQHRPRAARPHQLPSSVPAHPPPSFITSARRSHTQSARSHSLPKVVATACMQLQLAEPRA